ncbi:Uncharacterised protein [Legionella pneumophila]|nr:Uncharacterised protein [Legionella pneumophila]CZH30666.1 Uncharacterised protein [Legionella pneumophila]CZH46039.1 Uncharacterised protein [Legionella pneumophila]CZH46242.1 Uncharacterised protein [Legionella pneumophila]CZH48211.1 Uncharacterised protein [Legionella pneumophila]
MKKIQDGAYRREISWDGTMINRLIKKFRKCFTGIHD